jgi:hypothetical protein
MSFIWISLLTPSSHPRCDGGEQRGMRQTGDEFHALPREALRPASSKCDSWCVGRERDRHRVGTHAVARDAAGGMGGAPSRTGGNDALVISDLVDPGLAVVFAIVAITLSALVRLRKRGDFSDGRSSERHGRIEKGRLSSAEVDSRPDEGLS